jgi:DNA polymerase-3 subunit delta'
MKDFPSWLDPLIEPLEALAVRQQLPHALLIHGPAGNGRHLLALRLIGRALGLEEFDVKSGLGAGRSLDPESVPAHPDLALVQPAPDKRAISIDQVRRLIEFLNLTSHQSGAKVALVTPAQAMTHQAGNGLLKTLEEPPGNSLIILVTDALSRLAPTIISRCHRVRVSPPSHEDALAWLHDQAADIDWAPILKLAHGAPVRALQLQQTDFPKQAAQFEQDISALRNRSMTPGAVARRWVRLDPEQSLLWLYHYISDEIRTVVTNRPDFDEKLGNSRLQMMNKTLNIEKSFAGLRELDELRRLQGAGLNADLQLANLLTRWFGQGQLDSHSDA